MQIPRLRFRLRLLNFLRRLIRRPLHARLSLEKRRLAGKNRELQQRVEEQAAKLRVMECEIAELYAMAARNLTRVEAETQEFALRMATARVDADRVR